jgi:uncharacterized protein (PEP-CTERM system associated)
MHRASGLIGRPHRHKRAAAPQTLRPLAAALLLAVAGPVVAQDGASAARPLSVVATLGSTLSYSDVSGSGGGGSGFSGGQFVARVSPGIDVRSRSGSIVGSLSYTLNANYYSRREQQRETDTLEHALSANLVAEAVPKWLYVDGRASVTRQAISVFGLQTVDGSGVANANRTDVLNLSLSPYAKGLLGDVAEYELRLLAGAVNANNSKLLDSTSHGTVLSLKSRGGPRARFGWTLQAAQQTTDYRVGRATDSTRLLASLSFSPDVDWVFALRGGVEETDVGGLQTFRYDNWGAGVRWTPTPRTVVSLDADRRYFGNGHQVTLEHRFRRAGVRFISTRDASSGTDALGKDQPVTLYQLYFVQFAALQPDPELRRELVLSFLRVLGQDPNAVVGGGQLGGGGVTLQQRNDLSLFINGVRSSFTLLASSSFSRLLDNPNGLLDTGPLRQTGLSASASHRLTPRMTANLLGSVLNTQANLTNPSNRLKSISLGLSTVLNTRTTAAVTARYSVFDATAATSYRESALSASLNLRF